VRQRWIGPSVVGVGALVVIVGIIGTVGGSDATAEARPTSSTTTTVPTTAETSTTITATSTSATVTTSTATSTSTTTTTSIPSTSTSSTSTTTTVAPGETVEEFVTTFAAAIAAGDNAFVFGRLHPVIIESYGEDLCRAWVDREIMALEDYTLVSVDGGPITQTFVTPAGNVTVDDYYTTTVSFTYQGQGFETIGAFAAVGPDMYFLGQCR
jgi:hypothetical protein